MNIYQDTTRFYKKAWTEKKIIGTSLLKRNIYAIKMGEGSPVGIAVYGIHGREWITAKLATEHYAHGAVGTVWLIPLANPDGALLSQQGIASAQGSPYSRFLSAYSNGELRLWKANARGVDLNVNFDADWGKGEKNVRMRGAENFIGESPFSEPETKALRDFTLAISPDYTVSFHAKGEEIYWYFGQSQEDCVRDFRIGRSLAKATGYPLRQSKGSVGGYKDWCIQQMRIPAYTVEVGSDAATHPLGYTAYLEIRKRCGGALNALAHGVLKG